MTPNAGNPDPVGAAPDAFDAPVRLGLDQLCRLARVSPQWLRERAHAGLLDVDASESAAVAVEHWHFEAVQLRRVQRMHRIERDFDAVPELAALVADLHEEIDRLRDALTRHGLRADLPWPRR